MDAVSMQWFFNTLTTKKSLKNIAHCGKIV